MHMPETKIKPHIFFAYDENFEWMKKMSYLFPIIFGLVIPPPYWNTATDYI